LSRTAITFTDVTAQIYIFYLIFFQLFKTETVQTGVIMNKLFHYTAHM